MKKKTKIGIIGLGYVGLPLFVEFSKKFEVKGFDLSKKKIKQLHKKEDYTNQFGKKELAKISKTNVSYNSDILKNCNFYIITVPTPINSNKLPDLSSIILATKTVCNYIKDKDYIVYESTVYPGVTEDICIKIIEKKTGLKPFNNFNKNLKKGFYYGYSPERINPGDEKHNLKNIIKVTSGGTRSSARYIDNLYKKICLAGTFRAESVKIAEGAKAIENTQRDINIALVNEFTQIFSKMNINIHDVLKAANTKWNFLNFKPGLVGGHCIGIDPYYLAFKAKQVGYNSKLILAGRKLNDEMHFFVIEKLFKKLKKNFKKRKYKILLAGLSFKENINDFRNSRSVKLAEILNKKGHVLDVFDNNVSSKEFKREHNLNFIQKPKKSYYDAVLITVAHKKFRLLNKNFFISLLKDKQKGVIFDMKNIFKNKNFVSF